jgi:hypothetical protein
MRVIFANDLRPLSRLSPSSYQKKIMIMKMMVVVAELIYGSREISSVEFTPILSGCFCRKRDQS